MAARAGPRPSPRRCSPSPSWASWCSRSSCPPAASPTRSVVGRSTSSPRSSTSSPRWSSSSPTPSGRSPLAAALIGVFRALDSGPLEAWYVDTVHVTEPGADVDRTLAAQSTVLGGSIAVGAVLSGGLIAWDPLPGDSALLLPLLVWAVLNVVHLRGHRGAADAGAAHPPRRDRRPAGRRTRCARRRSSIREGLGLLRQQPGAARAGAGRDLLVDRDGRLRDVPADPAGGAGRAARSRPVR